MHSSDTKSSFRDPFIPYTTREINWMQIETLIHRLIEENHKLHLSFENSLSGDFVVNSKKLNNLARYLYSILYESSMGKLKHVQIAQKLQNVTRKLETNVSKTPSSFHEFAPEMVLINQCIESLINV